jgi:hypothetical protein
MRRLLPLLFLAACATEAPAPEAAEAPAAKVPAAAPADAPKPEAVADEEEGEPEATDGVKDGEWTRFGGEFTQEEVVAAASLLGDPAKYVDQTVRVEGRVADVCQKAGCWMVLADGDKLMRVRMKDHGFAVARDGAGATCQIEGQVIAKTIDAKEVAHFEGESAKVEAMPEKTQEVGETTYEIVASAVQFKDS